MTAPQPTALITGASRGIGRAIALRLAPRWRIVALARSARELDTLSTEISREGGTCESLVMDVRDGPAVRSALAGREIDVAVNNAGVGVLKPFIELTPEEWQLMMDVNLGAVYHVTHAVLPGMIERGRGHVVIIGSISGKTGFAGGTVYAATKFAVNGFAESLMLEVRDAGVKVSVVMPGSVATSFSRTGHDQSWKLMAEDVAESVAFLLDTPQRMLVDRIEMRPLNPPRKK
ncbi:MAG TPA: SDR family NAD(P)-dependent oxidoreductase [Gemmatimonadaceae bacterium]|nr:SDR family NAD(P)-dependent oxidoreductase [Gemmatimonadaceae bacterium]